MSRAIFAFLVISVILASPIWLSLIVWFAPNRMPIVPILACMLQLLIALGLWWFFWGGGIGGEADLSQKWQLVGLLAALPLGTAVAKYSWRRGSNTSTTRR